MSSLPSPGEGGGPVSVIVPTYNRQGYIAECIESLLAQTVRPLEIIVVDDGSEDDTPAVLQRFGHSISVLRKANGGKPRAVNLGVAQARGQWVWILDDDDVATPDAIASRLQALAAAPDAGFVYAPHWLGVDGPNGRIVRTRVNRPWQPSADAFFFEVMRACFFHLGSTLFKRELFLQLGGLNPALAAGEDYEFQIRLARHARPAYCAAPAFVFRQHGGTRGAKAERYRAEERERVFRACSQVIGRQIRAELTLADFLVPRRQGTLPEGERCQALCHRLQVMGNHGCLPEMLTDISELSAAGPAGSRWPPAWHAAVASAVQQGWAYSVAQDDWPAFMAALRRADVQGAALRALAAGVGAMARGYPGSLAERCARAWHAAYLWCCSWRPAAARGKED
jgi:GT2 family glycosyltransferase